MATASTKNLIISLLVRELTSFKVGGHARNLFTVVNYKIKSHAFLKEVPPNLFCFNAFL